MIDLPERLIEADKEAAAKLPRSEKSYLKEIRDLLVELITIVKEKHI